MYIIPSICILWKTESRTWNICINENWMNTNNVTFCCVEKKIYLSRQLQYVKSYATSYSKFSKENKEFWPRIIMVTTLIIIVSIYSIYRWNILANHICLLNCGNKYLQEVTFKSSSKIKNYSNLDSLTATCQSANKEQS